MKKIITIVVSVISGLLILLSVMLIIAGIKVANKPNDIAKIFGVGYSVVATDSMEPTIMTGSVIIVKEKDFESIELDDILVFFSEIDKIRKVHRVVSIEEDGTLRTKGDKDGAPIDSDIITSEMTIGVVISHFRFLGIGNMIMNYRNIVFVFIGLILVIVIVKEVVSITYNLNKKQMAENTEEVLEKARQKLKEEIMAEELAKIAKDQEENKSK